MALNLTSVKVVSDLGTETLKEQCGMTVGQIRAKMAIPANYLAVRLIPGDGSEEVRDTALLGSRDCELHFNAVHREKGR